MTNTLLLFGYDYARENIVLTLQTELRLPGLTAHTSRLFLATIPSRVLADGSRVGFALKVLNNMRPEGQRFLDLNSPAVLNALNDLLIQVNGDSHVGSARVQQAGR